MVPGRLARSADEAAEIARELGTPVALKINSAHVTHKSDIGAVLLNLSGDAAVRDGYAQVVAAAQTHNAGNEVLVTAMRTGGVEVLAGVTIDPGFGPVLAVGLGGIWVEVLGDSSLRILPADAAEVRRMLGELRALPVLQGARGGPLLTSMPLPPSSPASASWPVRSADCRHWRLTRSGLAAAR